MEHRPATVDGPNIAAPRAASNRARSPHTRSIAARVVFERDGYLDARLTDITKEVNCSTGTFYTYFAGKEEIVAAVLETAQEDMLHPGMGRVAPTDDPYAVVEASNRAYFEAYRRNARLMGLLDQVANIDPDFHALRGRRASAFVGRNARAIADLQERGVADPQLDPLMAARALSSMVSRLAFGAFVVGFESDGNQSLSYAEANHPGDQETPCSSSTATAA